MSDGPIISIRNVSKRFGKFVALENISIDIEPGEFFALLGPSGCGKSTLLRIIAGLDSPTEGHVLLDGEDMTNIPANKRPINMVFQSYAVFPHMSVAKNVAYGLKLQKTPKAEIDAAVEEVLEQVHLTQFRDRMPDQLSGGQRQRVALARALVKRPRVLLLDEPLSALDAKLRDAMRLELVKLQQTVGVSFIMVTHDQAEALAMADRIAVLEAGRLRQLDSPAGLYQQPRDAFVADFIGKINLFPLNAVETQGGAATLITEELGAQTAPVAALSGPAPSAEDTVLAIRPENLRLHFTLPTTEGAAVQGRLGDVAFQGESSVVEVILANGTSISVFVQESNADELHAAPEDAVVWCSWDSHDLLVLPKSLI